MASGRSGAQRILARIAARAEGVVTREEALAAGMSRNQINHRRDAGLLIAAHRGTYRLGHRAPSVAARYMAAVRACGKRAALSGLAAAWFYGLIGGLAPPPEVTSPTERRRAGIVTHRARRTPIESTHWRGMPITTVPRTLVDIARCLDEDELARACHEAGVRHGVTPAMIDAVRAAHPNAAGARKLRRILRGEIPVALSSLERAFHAQLGEAGLPLPETNRRAGRHLVDCRWPEWRLTVELDSYRYHNSRYSWEQDREREREARRRGDEFRRYTYEDVFVSPEAMIDELRRLLGARSRYALKR